MSGNKKLDHNDEVELLDLNDETELEDHNDEVELEDMSISSELSQEAEVEKKDSVEPEKHSSSPTEPEATNTGTKSTESSSPPEPKATSAESSSPTEPEAKSAGTKSTESKPSSPTEPASDTNPKSPTQTPRSEASNKADAKPPAHVKKLQALTPEEYHQFYENFYYLWYVCTEVASNEFNLHRIQSKTDNLINLLKAKRPDHLLLPYLDNLQATINDKDHIENNLKKLEKAIDKYLILAVDENFKLEKNYHDFFELIEINKSTITFLEATVNKEEKLKQLHYTINANKFLLDHLEAAKASLLEDETNLQELKQRIDEHIQVIIETNQKAKEILHQVEDKNEIPAKKFWGTAHFSDEAYPISKSPDDIAKAVQEKLTNLTTQDAVTFSTTNKQKFKTNLQVEDDQALLTCTTCYDNNKKERKFVTVSTVTPTSFRVAVHMNFENVSEKTLKARACELIDNYLLHDPYGPPMVIKNVCESNKSFAIEVMKECDRRGIFCKNNEIRKVLTQDKNAANTHQKMIEDKPKKFFGEDSTFKYRLFGINKVRDMRRFTHTTVEEVEANRRNRVLR